MPPWRRQCAAVEKGPVAKHHAVPAVVNSFGDSLKHPCWAGNQIGFEPFPVDVVTR